MNNLRIQTLTILLILSPLTSTAFCPSPSKNGSIHSSRIIIAQQRSYLQLKTDRQSQCFNYPLPFAFTDTPSVSLSIRDFIALPTNHLFLIIKPKRSNSKTYIPLLIRHPWRYTKWAKIVLNMLVQDRPDIESGYYQIDSGSLADCSAQKYINILIPFREIRNGTNAKHLIFLNGFEMSTQPYPSREAGQVSFSPYDLQITNSTAKYTGMDVFFSVTTITEVYSAVISYVAWTSTSLNIASGQNKFERVSVSQEYIRFQPPSVVGRNYARIIGISGFIINNNEQYLYLKTNWFGTHYEMELRQSQRLVQYLTLQYLFIQGSPCSDCPGYDYVANGTCSTFCPIGSFPTQLLTCIYCGDGFYWNGNICVRGQNPFSTPVLTTVTNSQPPNGVLFNLAQSEGNYGQNQTNSPKTQVYTCPGGRIYDEAYNRCYCPQGTHWNEKQCLVCDKGTIYNQTTKSCRCPKDQRWNGLSCHDPVICENGTQWNIFQFKCKCPFSSSWNGTFCVSKNVCKNGKSLNQNNECACPPQTYENGQWCETVNCQGGQVWNGLQCECEKGYNFNGSLCLLCINGQEWNEKNRTCSCPPSYIWNGNSCERVVQCSGYRVWNQLYQQCICPDNYFWNGFACMIQPPCCCGQIWNKQSLKCKCPSSFNWDGNNCVLCINGKIWNQDTDQCVCRKGTKWNGQFCVVVQQCFRGMIWNQNTWSCECPSTSVYNGIYCVANPCHGGQVWDNFHKRCTCLEDRVFVSNLCVPAQVPCEDRKLWNQTTFSCVCPPGKWDSGLRCEDIPVCEDNKIYNPITNKCICPYYLVWFEQKKQCLDPSCPENKRWNGQGCIDIQCPPNSYFNGSQCICPDKQSLCKHWEYYDGTRCVFYQNKCPQGTNWNGSLCEPDINGCPVGFYKINSECIPFSQHCIPPSFWDEGRCNHRQQCPYSTYYNNENCYPYVPCNQNQVWSQKFIQCLCPEGTQWNNENCLTCSGGKIWQPFSGCICPTGYFFIGTQCQRISQPRCSVIPKALWDGQQCLCHEGFEAIGLQCVCQGVEYNNYCDRCSHRPNSQWKYGKCRCKPGFSPIGTECLGNQLGSDTEQECSPGNFFNTQQKRCLSCVQGCLSCTQSFQCRQCRPQFSYNIDSRLCIEYCGDGKKFTVECDDGNNKNGDGCSEDCKAEMGYTCRGGSPNSKDSCIMYIPQKVTLTQTGQIRYETRIIINVKVDYLPKSLLQSKDCIDECRNILDVNIINEKALSIKSQYLVGTSYTFLVELEFGRNHMSIFDVEIRIKTNLKKYFQSVGIEGSLKAKVNPAILSLVSEQRI